MFSNEPVLTQPNNHIYQALQQMCLPITKNFSLTMSLNELYTAIANFNKQSKITKSLVSLESFNL